MAVTEQSILSDALLARCAERAPIYDQENRFFDEDFAELRDVGYLRLNVPQELGGLGRSLPEVCREQRRLSYHAHATALAVNMHLYWTGVAADLWRAGDRSLEWMLKGAVAGEVFAAGHAESGNDMPVGASLCPTAILAAWWPLAPLASTCLCWASLKPPGWNGSSRMPVWDAFIQPTRHWRMNL
jgi:alkylation response protein AidB-like acyl-CoA dehydrogenase